MSLRFKWFTFPVAAVLVAGAAADQAAERIVAKKDVVEITGQGPAVLWRYPNDIATRDMIYGAGGKAHAPSEGPFTFVKEDTGGTNPKFDATDSAGVKWKVKTGIEAKPETVATRFVWAVGYFVDEDYFLQELRLKNVPAKLRRGAKYVSSDGVVSGARLERPPYPHAKKLGEWQWWDNPFLGKRELNGLRVLMAVLNNWDLKDTNNRIFQVTGPDGPFQLYEVSDLGASFGTPGFGWTKSGSRGNVKAYTKSKWIKNIEAEFIDFNVPSRPAIDHYPDVPDTLKRLKLRKIGWQIPREDARWMGDLLGQLSGAQIRDAFRSAGYDSATVESFSREVEERIAELKSL